MTSKGGTVVTGRFYVNNQEERMEQAFSSYLDVIEATCLALSSKDVDLTVGIANTLRWSRHSLP